MAKHKAVPETVSHQPLFDWFEADKKNRAKLRAAGYTDGRITNWKRRGGIPRGEVGAVAAHMGLNYEQYLQRAGVQLNEVREPAYGAYGQPSEEALEIARAFDQMQPQAREYIREQVFIYTVIDKQFPWLRHGKPIGKTYAAFEKWHLDNIEVMRDTEGKAAGVRPRDMHELRKTREKAR